METNHYVNKFENQLLVRLRVLFFLHRKFYLYVQWLEFFAINIVGLILIRGSYYNESAVNAP